MPSQFVYHVYGLLCPPTNKIRYVGQSKKVVEWYRHHVNLWDINKRNGRQANGLPLKPKHYWLMELRERGIKPELVILQTLAARPETSGGTPRLVVEAERSWIECLSNAGHPLTNSAHERATPVLAQERDARIFREAAQRGRKIVTALHVDPSELDEE